MSGKNNVRRAFGSRYRIDVSRFPHDRAPSTYGMADILDPAREQRLLDVLPAMLFTSRPDGTWDYVNPSFCAYTGWPPEALTGMGWVAALHDEDRDASITRWQVAIRRGAPFQSEHRLRGTDGVHQLFHTWCAPQRSAAGTITRWAGMSAPIDTTPQVAAERALRRAAEQARDERDDAIAMISHELRAPLTVLLGQAQLLQRQLRARPEAEPRDRRAANLLGEQTLRLAQLIHALTDVTHIDQGQLHITTATLDLSPLVERVVQTLQPMLPAHTLQLSVDAAPLWVMGDAIRLEQVLQNLLQNAVKYSPAGGEIAIRLAYQGHQARIAVSDRGVGIEQGSIPHLFQRFYRAKLADGLFTTGLGLGLYICKAIVDLHGGSIAVESRIGEGTTFVVLLPSADAQPIAGLTLAVGDPRLHRASGIAPERG